MVFGEMFLVFGAGMLAGFVVAYPKALRYWKTRVGTPSASTNNRYATALEVYREAQEHRITMTYSCDLERWLRERLNAENGTSHS